MLCDVASSTSNIYYVGIYTMATKKNTKKSVAKQAEKKQPDDLVRKIQRQNNGSTTVTLPAHLVRELRWRDKQKVVVKVRGKGLIIEDWRG
jgi:Ni/Co efflux regulator RcnB